MEKQGYKQWKAGHAIRTEALVQYSSYRNMYTQAHNTLIQESGSMPFQPANVPMAFTLQVDKSRSTDTEMKKTQDILPTYQLLCVSNYNDNRTNRSKV